LSWLVDKYKVVLHNGEPAIMFELETGDGGAEHFASFERTRHPWHDPPKQALAKTFSRASWTRGPVRFAFNRTAYAESSREDGAAATSHG
jgi:hypothetical protein